MNQAAGSRRPTFGELAIRAGWLGDAHVNWALSVQQDRKRAGVHLYVGAILVQQRYITVQQALQLLKHQHVQIMVDPSTGYRYNVHNFQQGMTYKSPESQANLQVLPNPDSLLVRGDIGLRQVQQQGGTGGGAGGWADGAAAQAQGGGNWDQWGGGGGGQAQGTAEGPVYAELTSDEKKGGDEDYDWYGQTILDDGSLADQLKQAAAEAKGGAAASNPIPAATAAATAQPISADISSATGVRAKAGTVAFIAMPFDPSFEPVYRALTDLCALKGIGTVRLDDVSDASLIWKGIERFISGSHIVIGDLSGSPQPPQHVLQEVQTAVRGRKPTVVITSTAATRASAQQAGVQLVAEYPAGDPAGMCRSAEPMIDQALQQANLRAQ